MVFWNARGVYLLAITRGRPGFSMGSVLHLDLPPMCGQLPSADSQKWATPRERVRGRNEATAARATGRGQMGPREHSGAASVKVGGVWRMGT